MSKRNVAFIKPDEPSFLKQIKQQIGYKEGPDINTKRQKLERNSDDEDFSDDLDEESPQVVVLKEGDLTAEQADVEKKRLEVGKSGLLRVWKDFLTNRSYLLAEESQKKADLTERVIFKAKSKPLDKEELKAEKSTTKKEKKASKASKSKLSFVDDEDEEEGKRETFNVDIIDFKG